MWEDDDIDERIESERRRRMAMDEKLRNAVVAEPNSEPGCWLVGVLRTWNADPAENDEEKEEARLLISRLKALFISEATELAGRVAGVVSRIEILDLLHERLYGRAIHSDWPEDYLAARKAGEASGNYEDYSKARQAKIRQAGHDWPYAYVESVDAGSHVKLRDFVVSHLDRAVRQLVQERKSDEPDLGIVFVHGIGTQGRGETLQHFGDSLLEWVDEWLRSQRLEWGRCQDHESWNREAAYLSVVDAAVRGGGDEPAHAIASIPLLRERWLLSEAWWAEELHVPSRSRQVGWLLRVIPIAVITHLSRLWAWRMSGVRAWSEGSGYRNAIYLFATTLAFLATSLAGTVLALLLQFTVIVTGIVAIFPVRHARALLSLLQATVGDSLSFTESIIANSAIISRVRSAIDYAARHSKRVAVVAHSQGAAIAHRALRVYPPENVELLVTLGAGINKLEMLHRSRRQQILFEALAISICAAPLYVLYVTTIAPQITTLDAYLVGFFFVVYIAAWSLPRRQGERVDAFKLPSIRWRDFYAKSDPVPNGPIALKETDVVDSKMVHNLSSALRDHTSYWHNRDEFVASLVGALGESRLTGLIERDGKPKVLEVMVARRHQRLFWLRLLRRSFALAALLVLVAVWDSLVPIGRDEVGRLIAPLGDWLGDWAATNPFTWLEQLNDQLAQRALAMWSDLPYRAAGAVGILLVLAVWYLPAKWMWEWWNASSMHRFTTQKTGLYPEHESMRVSGIYSLFFLSATTTIQLMPLALTAWLDPSSWIVISFAIGGLVLSLGVAAVLSVRMDLGFGASQIFERDHVPTVRFMLSILLLVAGIWLSAAIIASKKSLYALYDILSREAARVLGVVEDHPVVLLPFLIYLVFATAAIRRTIDSIAEEGSDTSD